MRPGRIGVDTGAYRSGILSAIVLDGAKQRAIQVGSGRRNDSLGLASLWKTAEMAATARTSGVADRLWERLR